MTPSRVLYWQPISRKAYRRQRMKEWGIAIGLALVVTVIGFAARAEARPRDRDANGNFARQVIGHRPANCPRAWCGCGLRKYLERLTGNRVFADERLDLAWNWQKVFPHTTGHDGAVAVHRHHVVLVERHIEGTRYLVRDFNWNRGLAWLHVRDLRGFVFVEPTRASAAL